MSPPREHRPAAADRRAVLRAPLLGWAALLLLGAAGLALGSLPVPGRLPLQLLVAAMQAAVVGLAFMELRRAGGLVLACLVAGPVWLGFLFLLSFADFLTR